MKGSRRCSLGFPPSTFVATDLLCAVRIDNPVLKWFSQRIALPASHLHLHKQEGFDEVAQFCRGLCKAVGGVQAAAEGAKEKVWFGIPLGKLTLRVRDLGDVDLDMAAINSKNKIHELQFLVPHPAQSSARVQLTRLVGGHETLQSVRPAAPWIQCSRIHHLEWIQTCEIQRDRTWNRDPEIESRKWI